MRLRTPGTRQPGIRAFRIEQRRLPADVEQGLAEGLELGDIHLQHHRAGRAGCSPLEHLFDRGSRPLDFELDRAVPEVAHPPADPRGAGTLLRREPVSDSLDPTGDHRSTTYAMHDLEARRFAAERVDSPGRTGLGGEMSPLIPDDYLSLLRDPNYGHLGTIRPDDTVQVNPMWFEYEDGVVRFTHTTTRGKFRNLLHNPSMALSVIDPENPFRYLEVRGRLIDTVADPDGVFYVRLGRRYGNPTQQPPPDKADRVILVMRIEGSTRQ